MSKRKRLFASKEFIRFVLVGGFAALVNFISRIYYNLLMSFSHAIIVAYITGMITAFILNKLLVFAPSRHPTVKQIAYFTLVNLAAVAQTWAISLLLYRYGLDWLDFSNFVWPYPNNLQLSSIQLDLTQYKQEVAHFIGISVPVFSSYIGHKYLTFKH